MKEDLSKYHADIVQKIVTHDKLKNGSHLYIFQDYRGAVIEQNKSKRKTIICTMKIEDLNLLDQFGYIMIHKNTSTFAGLTTYYFSFILNKKAYDFANFIRKPKPIRKLINFFEKLFDELPSLIWGIIGGVTSYIAIHYISTWLGNKP